MKPILSFLLFIFFVHYVSAQDVIINNDGTLIQAKVIAVSYQESTITFKRFDQLEGPLYTIPSLGVKMINYENGNKDQFDPAMINAFTVSKPNVDRFSNFAQHELNEISFEKGKTDGMIKYTGKNSGKIAIAVTTLFVSPFISCIPSLIVSSSAPSDKNLNLQDSEFLDKSYYLGFKKSAHKRKKLEVLKGFVLGTVGWFTIVGISNL